MTSALRHNARRDENEAEIVQWLNSVGASVVKLAGGGGCPDLAVGFNGETYLIEVKTKHGKLNKAQERLHASWNGKPIQIARNPWDALQIIGAAG
jgi:hypothetical protein